MISNLGYTNLFNVNTYLGCMNHYNNFRAEILKGGQQVLNLDAYHDQGNKKSFFSGCSLFPRISC